MVELAHAIELELGERMRDPEFRKKFFVAETSARIAAQIIALRKKRGLSQKELAEKIGTGQPAISRAERADYNNWSFNTLRSIAEELDARIRVIIEPAESILHQYETSKIFDGCTIVASASYPEESVSSACKRTEIATSRQPSYLQFQEA